MKSAIYSASKNIVTSYSVFLADDDIILLGGLIEAVNFLKKIKPMWVQLENPLCLEQ